ncbi:MAG: substrate-binding domain-containing protein, partial [Cellulomonadaceae bacterium]|nr:substrate-binding domain-containing protein [Cellulomonadaceae bacterium]
MPRVRLADIAARVGVSTKTVSNVVNGTGWVSDPVRNRILAAIDELGYRPNLAARQLRTGSSGLLALCVPNLREPYFAEFASEFVSSAQARGLIVLVTESKGDRATELSMLECENLPAIDGLVFSPLRLTPSDIAARRSVVPLVVIGEHGEGLASDAITHVGPDNTAAAELATRHLLDSGRTRIAAIGLQQGTAGTTARVRFEGYRRALAAAGIELDPALLVEVERYNRAEGSQAVERLIASGVQFDGIFCFNDSLAFGALYTLAVRGIAVPEAVQVVGYDNIEEGTFTVPPLTTPGTSEVVTFGVADLAVQAGDVLAFYGQGIPLDIGTGGDFASIPAYVPALPLQGSVIALGESVYPSLGQARTYSFGAEVIETGTGSISGGIRKFLNGLPGLTPAGANGLLTPGGDPAGQYISVAEKDIATYAGSDYYEIAVVQYREKMHTDLPPTLLRGYVQLAGKKTGAACPAGTVELFNAPLDPLGTPAPTGYCGVDHPHYLGATIAATKDRPVRILFRNLLPTTDLGGDLFIPTDITVMGSGMGPSMWGMPEADPQDPTCGQDPKPEGCYTENRAVLHLHGGRTPWISDGTPHQWITPFGERDHLTDNGANPPIALENKGDSVQYVPDMWYDASGATIASCAGQTTCNLAGATN